MPVSVQFVDPDVTVYPPIDMATEPMSDNLARWASRLLGYASLIGACVVMVKIVF